MKNCQECEGVIRSERSLKTGQKAPEKYLNHLNVSVSNAPVDVQKTLSRIITQNKIAQNVTSRSAVHNCGKCSSWRLLHLVCYQTQKTGRYGADSSSK